MRRLLSLLLLGIVWTLVGAPARAGEAALTSPFRKMGQYNGKTLVDPSSQALETLRRGEQTVVLKSVLLADGSVQDFQATRFDVFAPDAEVIAFDGKTTEALAPPEVIAYVGTAINDPSQSIYISVTEDDQLWMLVNGGKSETNSFLAPDKGTDGTTRHLLSKVATEDLEGFTCGIESLPQAGEMLDKFYEPGEKTAAEKATATTLEAELLLDVGSALLNQRFSGNPNTAKSYVANLVGAVSSIYKRDLNTVLTVKQLVVWTSQDPFGTGSSTDQLSKYRSYNLSNRSGTARDLAHLLSTKSRLDGIAYVSALCSGNYGYGVTNLGGNANFNVSSYQWDIYAFAHEIGHNFGSPHTHCYSPPVDCCYASESGCKQCSTAVAQTGSLMSYCHLNGTINMSFHSRTVNVMRNAAENASCITAYVPVNAPEIAVRGQGLEIHTGDSAPSYSDGTNFGNAGVAGGETIKTFVIANTGTADLLMDGAPTVAVSGMSAADFAVVNGPSTTTLAAGAETRFQMRFRPGAPGLRVATLTIQNNDRNEGLYSFAVQGVGIAGVGPRTVSYASSPVAIPDNNAAGVMIPLTLTGISGPVSDVNFRFDGQDCSSSIDATGVGVRHPYVGDLTFSLAAPDGTSITLIAKRGGSGDNFCQTILDDEGGGAAISTISSLGVPPAGPPYSGTFTPEQALAAFRGVDPNGTWQLHVSDTGASDVGVLNGFSLIITGPEVVLPPAPNAAISWGTTALQAPQALIKATVAATSYRIKGTALVANLGTLPTDSTTYVNFYLSDDAVAGSGDPLLSSKVIRSVKPAAPGKLPKAKKVTLKKKLTESPSGKFLIAVVHANFDIEAGNNVAVSTRLP